MEAEEKHAQRFVRKHALAVPIDIDAAAQKVARIEYIEFPADSDADGITLGPKTATPRIFVNKRKPRSRQIFTVAHEIGHIVIPWHTGNEITTLDEADTPLTSYFACEREANRFASELLMPLNWVKQLLGNADGKIESVLREIVETCEVSPIAAMLRVSAALPTGYVWAIANADGYIIKSGRTHGTLVRQASADGTILIANAYSFAVSTEIFSYSRTKYGWWSFVGNIPPNGSDARTWREVLNGILDDLNYQGAERKRVSSVVSSISGYILGQRQGGTVADRYAQVLSRFEQRDELGRVTKHKDFRTYVYKRVGEFDAQP